MTNTSIKSIRSFFIITLLFCVTLLSAQQTRLRNNLTHKVGQLNDSLRKYSGLSQQIRIVNDSVFHIVNTKEQFFSINVLKLGKYKSGKSKYKGVHFQPMKPLSKTENSFIVFGDTERMGHFAFNRIEDATVKKMYHLTLQMVDLMQALNQ